MFCLWVIPETPSRDTNGHDNVDGHLGKENEEEDEEVEGAVTPKEVRQKIMKQQLIYSHYDLLIHKG